MVRKKAHHNPSLAAVRVCVCVYVCVQTGTSTKISRDHARSPRRPSTSPPVPNNHRLSLKMNYMGPLAASRVKRPLDHQVSVSHVMKHFNRPISIFPVGARSLRDRSLLILLVESILLRHDSNMGKNISIKHILNSPDVTCSSSGS